MTHEPFLSIAVGIGLAAACGFRVFVPLLIMSVAAISAYLPLAPGFEWIGSPAACAAFAIATVLEVAAYKIPWLDQALDALATPAALVAGMVAAAAVMVDLPPLLRWSVVIIGGGGAAGLVQGATVLLRLKSTWTTGGVANPLISAAELAGSVFTALAAIVLPLVALFLVAAAGLVVVLMLGRSKSGGRRLP